MVKVDLKFKRPLPIHEEHYNNYEDYQAKTAEQGHKYQTDENISSKLGVERIDNKHPNFKMLSCHNVPFQLNYA